MSQSSARPDHLIGFALDLTAGTRRVDDQVDVITRAFAHFQSTCPTVDWIANPDWATRASLDAARDLATSVSQIARAFVAADGGQALSRVENNDLQLAQQLLRDAPGLVAGALADPLHEEEGRALARQVLSSAGAARQRALSEFAASGQSSSAAFANGFIDELGPHGLTEMFEDMQGGYAAIDLSITEADSMVGALSQLFALAARGSSPSTDAAFIDAVAATREGRNALRALILEIGLLPTSVVVALGTGLAMGDRAVGDIGPDVGRSLVFDLTRLHAPDHVPDPDLAIINLLGRDPVAAWLWEIHAGPTVSPTAMNFEAGRHSRPMVDAMAPVVHAVLVGSIGGGRATPYRELRYGVVPDPRAISARTTLPEVVRIAGDSAFSPAMSNTLAEVFASHPDFFREHAAAATYDADHDAVLIAYFASLARDRNALSAATRAAVALFGAEADRVAGRTNPNEATPSDLLGGLSDAHQVSVSLEAGARLAGQHHDAAAGVAVAIISFAASQGSGAVAKHPAAGPAGPVIKIAANAGIARAEQAAVDRWVDTNDGRADEATATTDRSEPYLLAVALARDPAWQALLVDPGSLSGLDVVRSATHRAVFAVWVSRQPASIRSLLIESMKPRRS